MTQKTTEKCVPCSGGVAPLSAQEVAHLLKECEGWQKVEGLEEIFRRFTFKGFAKAVEMANLAAWLGNKMGHHPDVKFGWGYCEVHYTSHEAGGLTENDFFCAKRLNELLS
ncbi:4a-hydroxytetrahydrobiopterin dehydratase [Acetobacteraceae bacterium]|nr:4a-hydroxytetrahydrobiopterin dehydratase [Acetobacteraceae bacterium]